MTVSYISFDFQDGFVHNWLVAGPQSIPAGKDTAIADPLFKTGLISKFYEESSGITHAPVEPGVPEKAQFTIGDFQGQWRYYRCRDDHAVDLSTTCPAVHYLRAWAYTVLSSPQAQTITCQLRTFGPVDVWTNKKLVYHAEQTSAQEAGHTFSLKLLKGANRMLIRFANIAAPEALLVIKLSVQASPEVGVQIPTLIPSIERRNELEQTNEEIYLDRDVYAYDQDIRLFWPNAVEKGAYQDARLINEEGFFYAQAEDVGKANRPVTLGVPSSLKEGRYRAFIMPRAWEYYESQIRVTQELELWTLGLNQFSEAPYGTTEERAQEALLNAAYREKNLFAELAKMALDAWADLDLKVIHQAAEAVQQRQAESEILMLGLAGMVARFGDHSRFPEEVREPIRCALLNYRYGQDEPGSDLLALDQEDCQVMAYTGEILASQLYPNQTFASTGLTGAQHREKGERQALSWLQGHAAQGFTCWDSKSRYAYILAALSYLVDLAASEVIWELASVLMDKLLFTIALNSYKGVYGSAQSDAVLWSIKSGLLEETSGITRLLWGMGIFNHHIEATVSLALMKNYELPVIIAQIAAAPGAEEWNHEQQAFGKSVVNKVTYRTPSYMLSSALDYHPGQPGCREQIWQATFGSQCQVFVNHPGNAHELSAHTPNFWLGNGTLPRVAQWKDTLIAIYNLDRTASLGYTHAWFPTLEFDEYTIEGNTAFARKGEGYLALTAAQGFDLIKAGRTALRELRSYGSTNIWICQMGQAATDGSFADFQQKVRSQVADFTGLQVNITTIRGDALSFGWEGDFLKNGDALPLKGFKHYDNPYTSADLPCSEMEIKTEDYLLRLNFTDLA